MPILKPSTSFNREEIANIITHGIGFLLFAGASPILLKFAAKSGTWYQILGLGIFCLSLLMVYSSSTIYHSILDQKLKGIFQKIDHICIYFLIAGTHTPFLLLYLNKPYGWAFLVFLWTIALIGILYKIFFMGRYKKLSLWLYIFMGWSAIFTIPLMFEQMNSNTIYGLVGGGLSYSLGTIFFVWEKLPFNHAIWHVFVIGGSLGHFLALFYCFV